MTPNHLLKTLLLAVAFMAPGTLHAQAPAEAEKKDYIMPHVLNGHELAIPSFGHGLEREIHLPRWAPIQIGGLTLDLSPSKHVVMLWISGALCLLVMVAAARGAAKAHAAGRPAKGLAGAVEAMVLYLRNDVILPNVGHHGEKYVAYCLSAFFMVLFCNLLGLFPYMATATGNISVTATLAVLSFLVIEIAGMRALGMGYINTIVWWPRDLPFAVKAPVTLIMTPVEILGKFTKPFALAMRLFANMTAGHIAVLALVGMIFTFAQMLNYSPAAYGAALIPVALSTAIMGLEVFVSFLQAFIFMLLTAVFIGQIRESHH
ncbi:ATP synthase subunit a 2 [Gemmatimonadota bacterium]|jgi:F-type H+-transporting ATPase subunit a|nr:ATP synthase subunit a 2 [Gemmatimonadota bacterium]